MSGVDDVRVVLNERGMQELLRDPSLRDYLLEVADRPTDRARQLAPKDTGLGAASIHAEAQLTDADGWEVDSGWDREHYYMLFHEVGTFFMPADPFMVPAWEEYIE